MLHLLLLLCCRGVALRLLPPLLLCVTMLHSRCYRCCCGSEHAALLLALAPAIVTARLPSCRPAHVCRCFYMEPEEDKEVVFLTKRTGFVR